MNCTKSSSKVPTHYLIVLCLNWVQPTACYDRGIPDPQLFYQSKQMLQPVGHRQASRSLVQLSNHYVQVQTVTIYLNFVSYFNSTIHHVNSRSPQWGAVVHDKRVPPPLHVQINICWLSAVVLMRPYVRGAFSLGIGATPWSIKIKRTLLNRTLRRHFPNKQFIVFSYTDTSNR